jgi:hypothetical protein
MGELLSVAAALVLVACFVVLAAYFVIVVLATTTTLREARYHDRLSADLDRVLDEVLGPRSHSHRVN